MQETFDHPATPTHHSPHHPICVAYHIVLSPSCPISSHHTPSRHHPLHLNPTCRMAPEGSCATLAPVQQHRAEA